MMRYAGIIKNDIAAGEGVNVTFFTQGCPLHCKGCHNPQTWDFKGGKEFTTATMNEIIEALHANGVQRNFSVMGGEPLCGENAFLTNMVVSEVRKVYPNIKIYVWSGYTYDELKALAQMEPKINLVLDKSDYLIAGPFILEQRDTSLPMRGSRNQEIIDIKEKRANEEKEY